MDEALPVTVGHPDITVTVAPVIKCNGAGRRKQARVIGGMGWGFKLQLHLTRHRNPNHLPDRRIGHVFIVVVGIPLAAVVGKPDRLDAAVGSQRQTVRLDDRHLERADQFAIGGKYHHQRFGRVKSDDLALGRKGRSMMGPAPGNGIGRWELRPVAHPLKI